MQGSGIGLALCFRSPGEDHEGGADYEKQRRGPGHTQISNSMQIENSHYGCAHQEKESNHAEKVR
jgi:hypothetical protein